MFVAASQGAARRPDGVPRESDEELVKAARRGDQRAFAELVDRYRGLVCSIAFDVTGSQLHGEDVGQEVFLRCWSRLCELREPARFRSWICQITRNLSLNFQRDQRSRAGSSKARQPAPDQVSGEPSALDSIISREDERFVWRALRELPEPYRRAIDLYYREEKSIKSVASLLDVTEMAIKLRLSRGRRMLEQRVVTLMESVLARRPEKSFTAGVIAAIATVGAPDLAAARPRAVKIARPLFIAAVAAGVAVPLGAGSLWLAGSRTVTSDGPTARRAVAASASDRARTRKALDFEPPPRFETTPWGGRETSGTTDVPEAQPAADLMRFDFEDGERPSDFKYGEIVPGPPRPGSRFAMAAMAMPSYPANVVSIDYNHKVIFRSSNDLVVSFDYWLPAGLTAMAVMTHVLNRANYAKILTKLPTQAWTHVEVRLSDIPPDKDAPRAPPLGPGDPIGAVFMCTGQEHGLFYVDNVRIFRLPAD